jgi:hypothetical protein
MCLNAASEYSHASLKTKVRTNLSNVASITVLYSDMYDHET